MDYLSIWESFLQIKILNYMIYTLFIMLEFCLFQTCLENSTLQDQSMGIEDHFETMCIKETSKRGPKDTLSEFTKIQEKEMKKKRRGCG